MTTAPAIPSTHCRLTSRQWRLVPVDEAFREGDRQHLRMLNRPMPPVAVLAEQLAMVAHDTNPRIGGNSANHPAKTPSGVLRRPHLPRPQLHHLFRIEERRQRRRPPSRQAAKYAVCAGEVCPLPAILIR